MTSSWGYPIIAIPEEILLLRQLNDINAMSQDRALTLQEISVQTGNIPSNVMENLLNRSIHRRSGPATWESTAQDMNLVRLPVVVRVVFSN